MSEAINYNLRLNSKLLIYLQVATRSDQEKKKVAKKKVATRWSPQWQARPNEPNLQAILKDHQTQ